MASNQGDGESVGDGAAGRLTRTQTREATIARQEAELDESRQELHRTLEENVSQAAKHQQDLAAKQEEVNELAAEVLQLRQAQAQPEEPRDNTPIVDQAADVGVNIGVTPPSIPHSTSNSNDQPSGGNSVRARAMPLARDTPAAQETSGGSSAGANPARDTPAANESYDKPAKIPAVKTAIPDKWGGSSKDLRQWIGKTKLYINLQGSSLSDPAQQVNLAASLLKETAWNWIAPFYAAPSALQPEWMRNVEALFEELERVFGDPDTEKAALRNLERTKHTGSVGKYVAEFSQWSTLLPAYGDAPMRDHFYSGLKDEVKDELAKVEKPQTFEALKTVAIRIDNRLFERRMEKTGATSREDSPTTRQSDSTGSRQKSRFRRYESKLNAVEAGEGARQTGQTRSDEQVICYNCGKKGHFARDCYSKKKEESNRRQRQDNDRRTPTNWRNAAPGARAAAINVFGGVSDHDESRHAPWRTTGKDRA